MIKYIDAHCHILPKVQSCDAIAGFVINAIMPDDWNTVVKMAQHDNVSGAIGVHPWFVSEIADDWESRLVDILKNNPCLMVGEIGLDKNHPDMEKQENIFRRQLQIAHDMKRVAHIHCVGAWGKMMEILRDSKLPPAMVFHAFSGPADLVPELVKMGGYFSFGRAVCDSRRVKLHAAVRAVPNRRILVESDATDDIMSNTIPETVLEIARLRGVNAEQMAETIYNNTMGLINDGKI